MQIILDIIPKLPIIYPMSSRQPTWQDPEYIAAIVQQSAQGLSCAEVGHSIGINKSTVHHARTRPDIRAMIDSLHQRLIVDNLNTIYLKLQALIDDYNKVSPKGIDPNAKYWTQRQDHGYRLMERILQGVGILPSQSPSIYISQIYNTQVNLELSDQVLIALSCMLDTGMPGDDLPGQVIDIIESKDEVSDK